MTTTQQTAIVYSRVSTGLQAASGLSLEAQHDAGVAHAERLGYAVHPVTDAGRSGKSIASRAGLMNALALLEDGHAHALIAAKSDRLTRSLVDLLYIVEHARRYGWRLIVLDSDVDSSTPSGQLLLSVMGSVAQFERSRIAERHRDWHSAKAARGIVWGRDAGPRNEQSDDTRALILDLRASGLSYPAIAQELTDRKIPTARGGKWQPTTVRKTVMAAAAGRIDA